MHYRCLRGRGNEPQLKTMRLFNTRERYGVVAVALHWMMVLLMIGSEDARPKTIAKATIISRSCTATGLRQIEQ